MQSPVFVSSESVSEWSCSVSLSSCSVSVPSRSVSVGGSWGAPDGVGLGLLSLLPEGLGVALPLAVLGGTGAVPVGGGALLRSRPESDSSSASRSAYSEGGGAVFPVGNGVGVWLLCARGAFLGLVDVHGVVPECEGASLRSRLESDSSLVSSSSWSVSPSSCSVSLLFSSSPSSEEVELCPVGRGAGVWVFFTARVVLGGAGMVDVHEVPECEGAALRSRLESDSSLVSVSSWSVSLAPVGGGAVAPVGNGVGVWVFFTRGVVLGGAGLFEVHEVVPECGALLRSRSEPDSSSVSVSSWSVSSAPEGGGAVLPVGNGVGVWVFFVGRVVLGGDGLFEVHVVVPEGGALLRSRPEPDSSSVSVSSWPVSASSESVSTSSEGGGAVLPVGNGVGVWVFFAEILVLGGAGLVDVHEVVPECEGAALRSRLESDSSLVSASSWSAPASSESISASSEGSWLVFPVGDGVRDWVLFARRVVLGGADVDVHVVVPAGRALLRSRLESDSSSVSVSSESVSASSQSASLSSGSVSPSSESVSSSVPSDSGWGRGVAEGDASGVVTVIIVVLAGGRGLPLGLGTELSGAGPNIG